VELERLSLWIGQNKDIKRHEPVQVEIPPTLVKLRDITIRGLTTTPVIPPLPALDILTLEKIRHLDINELPSIPSLKSLELYRCRIDFMDINLFETKYPTLRMLALCSADEETSLDLDFFPNLDCLEILFLSDVKIVQGEPRNEGCSKTTRLTRLTLNYSILESPHLLSSLKNDGNILKLTFNSCVFSCPFKLPESVGVKELVFRKCQPIVLGSLAGCSEANEKLESMTITYCHFNETDLKFLNKFPNLVELDLSGNSLKTKNIPRLHCLKLLKMVSCNLNNLDVGRILTNFPALVSLDLSKNKKLRKKFHKKHNSASINTLNSYFFTWKDLF